MVVTQGDTRSLDYSSCCWMTEWEIIGNRLLRTVSMQEDRGENGNSYVIAQFSGATIGIHPSIPY